ncbi:MAG: SufD family Fe-S cluster assembly protein [Gammaproteobacteria bacterium]|nr:SufD family Fe-S cluster assembly protein [Gammaproteobacteria bacterium]
MSRLAGRLSSQSRDRLEALSTAPQADPKVRESWKYNPVNRSLALLSDVDVAGPSAISGLDQRGVSFIENVQPDEAEIATLLSQSVNSPPSARALLLAESVDRLIVNDRLALPLRITRTDARHPLLITVSPQSEVVIEELAETSATGWICLHVRDGAMVSYNRLRSERASSEWQRLVMKLERDARLHLNHYATGSTLRRLDALIELAGAGAELDLQSAWTAAAREKIDQQWHVEHTAPQTTSRQVHHGIADGNATTTFRGRIFIGTDCRQANADLINRNLALSAGATCNTKPELEIHNDDVRCSHGATVGQLSDDSVFYFRSRGVSPNTARRLLAAGFIRSTLRGSLSAGARLALTGTADE